MKGKKGIELSVNFIVMLILAIVVFGLGIAFILNLFKIVPTWIKSIDPQTKDIINQRLATERLVVEPHQREVSKNSVSTYGIGIRNTIVGREYFMIKAELESATSSKNVKLDPDTVTIIFRVQEPEFSLLVNKQKIVNFGVNVPRSAVSGTYIYNIYVCSDANPPSDCTADSDLLYQAVKQAIVIVP
jgi:hypothetical protein